MRNGRTRLGRARSRFGYNGLYRVTDNDPNGILWTRSVYGSQSGELVVRYRDQNAATRRFVAEDERVRPSPPATIAATWSRSRPMTNTAVRRLAPARRTESSATQARTHREISTITRRGFTRPRSGSSLSPIPCRYSGDGPNLYAYVLDDPINFVDPLGWSFVTGTLTMCGRVGT